jgi:hypothetical protein
MSAKLPNPFLDAFSENVVELRRFKLDEAKFMAALRAPSRPDVLDDLKWLETNEARFTAAEIMPVLQALASGLRREG